MSKKKKTKPKEKVRILPHLDSTIAAICTGFNSLQPSISWIEIIELSAQSYLKNNPARPAAPYLRQAIKMARLTQQAIQQNDAHGAAFATAGALQAAWEAEIVEARQIIDAGVKSLGGIKYSNNIRKEKAEKKTKKWQLMADKLLEEHPEWNQKKIASEIAKLEPKNSRRKAKTQGADYIEKKIKLLKK